MAKVVLCQCFHNRTTLIMVSKLAIKIGSSKHLTQKTGPQQESDFLRNRILFGGEDMEYVLLFQMSI